MARSNAFYAQSGGVTSVINASACGVIESARGHKKFIGRVYAGKNGILGALEERLIDTSRETNKSKSHFHFFKPVIYPPKPSGETWSASNSLTNFP